MPVLRASTRPAPAARRATIRPPSAAVVVAAAAAVAGARRSLLDLPAPAPVLDRDRRRRDRLRRRGRAADQIHRDRAIPAPPAQRVALAPQRLQPGAAANASTAAGLPRIAPCTPDPRPPASPRTRQPSSRSPAGIPGVEHSPTSATEPSASTTGGAVQPGRLRPRSRRGASPRRRAPAATTRSPPRRPRSPAARPARTAARASGFVGTGSDTTCTASVCGRSSSSGHPAATPSSIAAAHRHRPAPPRQAVARHAAGTAGSECRRRLLARRALAARCRADAALVATQIAVPAAKLPRSSALRLPHVVAVRLLRWRLPRGTGSAQPLDVHLLDARQRPAAARHVLGDRAARAGTLRVRPHRDRRDSGRSPSR